MLHGMRIPWQAKLLCALALLTATEVRAATRLQFLLADGVLLVDGKHHSVDVDDPAERMLQLRESAARGEWDENLSRELGAALLGPAAELLRTEERWIVTPPAMAGLAALYLPGSDRRVVDEHELVYRFDNEDRDPPTIAAGGVLVVAPLVDGFDDLLDMPDTLLWELRAIERNVEQLPRNDATQRSVAAALGERSHGLAWLRATPPQASSLAPALIASAPLILWTHPALPVDRDVVLPTARGWVVSGRSIVVDLWNRSEGRAAPYWNSFFGTLAEGGDVAGALARARRMAAADAAPELWVGWIVLGDDTLRVDFDAPSFWRRWLDGLRSR